MKDTKASSAMTSTGASKVVDEPAGLKPKEEKVAVKTMKDMKAISAMSSSGASSVVDEPAGLKPKEEKVAVTTMKDMKAISAMSSSGASSVVAESTALSDDEDALVRPTKYRKLLAEESAMQGQPVQGQPVQGQERRGPERQRTKEIHLARQLLAGYARDDYCWSKDQCAEIIKAADVLDQNDKLTAKENLMYLKAQDENDYSDWWRRMIGGATQASSQG